MIRILIAMLLACSSARAALRPRPTNPVNVPEVPPATSWQPPWMGGFPIIK